MNIRHSQRRSIVSLLARLLVAPVLLGACATPVASDRAAAPAPASPAMALLEPTIVPTLSPTTVAAQSVMLEGKHTETLPAATGMSETSLKNAEYHLPDVGTFRLHDGTFEHQYGSGATQVNRVGLLQAEPGALDSSGKQGAVVFLWVNTGGSGTFVYIVAMTEQDGQPQQMAVDLLGDRVQVHSTSINDGQIVVNVGAFSPSDPLCCPSQQITRTYKLDGNRLQVVSEVKATPTPVPAPAKASTQAEELAKIRYLPPSHTCENAPASTIPAQWQRGARAEGTDGVEPGQPGKLVTLQLRNKLGPADTEYQARVLVIAPDGSITSTDSSFKGNDWLFLEYPKVFPGAHPTVPGTYTVVYQLNAGYVTCWGWEVTQ